MRKFFYLDHLNYTLEGQMAYNHVTTKSIMKSMELVMENGTVFGVGFLTMIPCPARPNTAKHTSECPMGYQSNRDQNYGMHATTQS